ncbi:aromatic hydrocarbon degradation protein [Sulfuricella sp. T08]|uniref:OmpP1/FadL family transporter n=1 Tax=Sulfuricella sp. T08 TaxID=1632857 RepID=UPI0006179E2F|nr:outer membrane protein transport protein [Sulfuricella sp. T08]GAO37401.1 aromatic hydrocarbon degradation protein [Sulfuricella sp. T08]
MKTKKMLFSSILAACAFPQLAFATNGMNMEGYGATALGMGGASMAYDNGTAAMMNNPATLAMMDEGSNLDLALGFLAPQVKSSAGGMTSSSSADFFGGPAIGWIRKHNGLLFGIGMYGQGGMGTEYGSDSIFANPGAQAVSPGLINRSEVSVGRVIFPVAYNVSPDLNIGGSVDYVWAGMDMQMAINGASFMQMAGGISPMASASGPMVSAFGSMMGAGAGQIGAVNWGYFDFSNKNDFTGQAVGTGYAGKIGFTYKLDSKTTIGATYHSKTRLSDLEAKDATVSFNVDVNSGPTNLTIPVSGKMTVKDFQWPETYGIGIAYEASEKWMLAADYKRINWAAVMKDFKMEFTPAGNTGMAANFDGLPMNVVFYQDWKDQHVLMLGAAYRMSDALTLRGGLNMANNTVPDTYLNALFPAIIKNHVTAGFGYAINKKSHLDLAFSYAPKVTATSGVTGITTSHEQYNGQLVYSYHF